MCVCFCLDPTAAVLKLSARGNAKRRLAVERGAYAKELLIYSGECPSQTLGVRLPRVYGCFVEEREGRWGDLEVDRLTLVLEDLTSADAFGEGGGVLTAGGARSLLRSDPAAAPTTYADLKRIVADLGRLQGASWNAGK